MLDLNMWNKPIDHVEAIRSYSSDRDSIKDISRLEYAEYMDLRRRHEEQLIDESPDKNSIRKTRLVFRNYA